MNANGHCEEGSGRMLMGDAGSRLPRRSFAVCGLIWLCMLLDGVDENIDPGVAIRGLWLIVRGTDDAAGLESPAL